MGSGFVKTRCTNSILLTIIMKLSQYIDLMDVDIQYVDRVDAVVQYIENRPQYIVIASIYFLTF